MEEEILQFLKDNSEPKFATFQQKLIPSKYIILGVRTPTLKKKAKELVKLANIDVFLDALPYKYYEELALHAFVISEIKDFDLAVMRIKKLLPYIDNWAVCDQLIPKCFAKNTDKLYPLVEEFIGSDQEFTVRYGIGLLYRYFLDDGFQTAHLYKVSEIVSDSYYVNMMRAWYFATALTKQYDETVKIVESGSLDLFTHNKTIQKAIESYRISPEHKTYLRSLKRK